MNRSLELILGARGRSTVCFDFGEPDIFHNGECLRHDASFRSSRFFGGKVVSFSRRNCFKESSHFENGRCFSGGGIAFCHGTAN